MNRLGLIAALAVATIIGLVFAIWPELDLYISKLFYDEHTKQFALASYPSLRNMRFLAMERTWIIFVFSLSLAVLLFLQQRAVLAKKRKAVRAIVFLLATLLIGPALFVNGLLKNHWARSNPVSVVEFDGTERFMPWWDPRGDCPRNCSFVSGEAAMAFWTVAPVALLRRRWRPLGYTMALISGVVAGVLRIVIGGQFFTDIAFAGVLIYLIIWLVYGLIYRWPVTRDVIEA